MCKVSAEIVAQWENVEERLYSKQYYDNESLNEDFREEMS